MCIVYVYIYHLIWYLSLNSKRNKVYISGWNSCALLEHRAPQVLPYSICDVRCNSIHIHLNKYTIHAHPHRYSIKQTTRQQLRALSATWIHHICARAWCASLGCYNASCDEPSSSIFFCELRHVILVEAFKAIRDCRHDPHFKPNLQVYCRRSVDRQRPIWLEELGHFI